MQLADGRPRLSVIIVCNFLRGGRLLDVRTYRTRVGGRAGGRRSYVHARSGAAGRPQPWWTSFSFLFASCFHTHARVHARTHKLALHGAVRTYYKL